MKFLAIGGEPATGKSSLVREVLAKYPDQQIFKQGLVNGHYLRKAKTFLLGQYTGHAFPGTDRLSMGVQPEAERFLRHVAKNYPDHCVMFEGDRLFNIKFLQAGIEVATLNQSWIVMLCASNAEKATRHVGRGDTQGDTFLKGRATKQANIARALPFLDQVRNESRQDQDALLGRVLNFLAS